MEKHTDGPWQFKELPLGKGFEISGKEYANDYALCSSIGSAWEESDARLIAAAPELLEALQECITDKSAYCIGNGSVTDLGRRLAAINEVCRAAIAKAAGE